MATFVIVHGGGDYREVVAPHDLHVAAPDEMVALLHERSDVGQEWALR